MKEITYLGYIIKRSTGDKGHVQYLMRKANSILGRIWGLAERFFKDEFQKRL